jgi:hypothetical protein
MIITVISSESIIASIGLKPYILANIICPTDHVVIQSPNHLMALARCHFPYKLFSMGGYLALSNVLL